MNVKRCGWVSNDTEYERYHDEEWGYPIIESKELFAKLCLDGQQAGLSWLTILKKQKGYESAFHQFDPYKIIEMPPQELEQLATNPAIIRSRQKINAIVENAKGYIKITEEGSFSDFIWQFTNYKTKVNTFTDYRQSPTATLESKAMAKALKRYGFKYVGETICYAFMQAVGMVNDHEIGCHCYERVKEQARK